MPRKTVKTFAVVRSSYLDDSAIKLNIYQVPITYKNTLLQLNACNQVAMTKTNLL